MADTTTLLEELGTRGVWAWHEISTFYVAQVRALYRLLRVNKWERAANMTATLLLEPLNTLRAAYLLQTGLRKKHFLNLNPTVLTEEQKAHTPVFLIHGDHSTSALFAPLIDYLTERDPHRPLFTIDLHSADGKVSAADHLETLIAKMHAIAALYPKTPKIALIGHSSGGDVIGPLSQKVSFSGCLIKIGSLFSESAAQEFNHYTQGPVWEIVGTNDVFEGYHSHLNNKLSIVSGHLGLLFNMRVLHHIYTEIQ